MGIYIGTSGWSYDHWHGVLYPHGISPTQRLEYYIGRYTTVELNSSYYQWSGAGAFRRWRYRLPEGFQMSVKAPRWLTHTQRLYAPERWMERIAHDVTFLNEKMGVLLVQLSPNFSYDYGRLHYFLRHIPSWLRTTIEFRHPSWHQEAVFSLLEQYQVAYCIMSGAYLPCILRTTAPFVYIRLHGPDHHHLYAGTYSDNDLSWWADRIREWTQKGKEVFAYFNNDGEGNAVRNANTLRRLLHLS